MSTKYTYSEIFHSVQGEGKYTGAPSAWLRMFLCNLQCDGFGQKDPTDPSTYELPYELLDVKQFDKLDDLPVFEKGCDSSYSWSKKYKHLCPSKTALEIADLIIDSMKTEWNPEGLFNHPSGLRQHMCFTGGEPLLKKSQECIVEVMNAFFDMANYPHYVTFETNGTQPLSADMKDIMDYAGCDDVEYFFSVSPKLFSVSGEKRNKAIKPEVVAEYANTSWHGQLKFVVDGTRRAWDEVEGVVRLFREHHIDYPVYIMPVGATLEGQQNVAGDIAREAYQRGYNVSARVHCYLWGNTIGV